MNLQEITEAVKAGKIVHWTGDYYTIVDGGKAGLLIKGLNGHAIGLVWEDGKTMNGREDQFYIEEPKDLFETPELIPADVDGVLSRYTPNYEWDYVRLELALFDIEKLGYTFEYGLDAIPFNLHKI